MSTNTAAEKPAKAPKEPKAPKAPKPAQGGGGDKGAKGAKQGAVVPIIGMTNAKETHFSAWYQELVLKAELVEYYSEVGLENV
jgi:prolyl-tRNA synthetase